MKKTELTARCRQILYGTPIGTAVASKDDEAFLLKLLQQHPDAERKIGQGINRIEVRPNPRFRGRTFYLIRIDGSETDFSFTKCVTAPSSKRLVHAALRDEIEDQIRAYAERIFRPGTTRCAISGETLQSGFHVDHASPTFDELASAFINREGMEKFELAHDDGTIGRRLVDRALAQRWRDYHRDHAHLRLVTAYANLSTLRRTV